MKTKHLVPIAVLTLALILVWLLRPSVSSPVQETNAEKKTFISKVASLRERRARGKLDSTADVPDVSASQPAASDPSAIVPHSMQLTKKILVSKKWNSGPDAFAVDRPAAGQEGAAIGPGAVIYANNRIHVLDNANQRILGFDKTGRQLSSTPLPAPQASDLVADSSGSMLFAVDHFHRTIYKVEGDQTTELETSLPLKDLPVGTKFTYDANTGSLSAQDNVGDYEGSNLILQLDPAQPPLSIRMEKPVACVEEVATGPDGIVWVLYTLEGDYRMRRVARVDPAARTAGVAEVDVWFAYDSTRHLAPTENGVVIVAGDMEEGRLLNFEYTDGDL